MLLWLTWKKRATTALRNANSADFSWCSGMSTCLHPALDPRALHPAGDVDGVPPDVVVEFRGADDAGRDVAKVEADAQHEVELDQALWMWLKTVN